MMIIYHIALITHIAGLAMMAGITLADFILFRQFWKQLAKAREGGLAVSEALFKLPIAFGIGILFLIASGVTMMAITHGAFGEQLWFRIKFALVILIIINGLAFGRRQGLKLRRFLTSGETGITMEQGLLKIKGNLQLFHLLQLAMFIIIFTLSVFKFN
ncbi:MAG TPA: hypothetical protein VM802_05975 [Chitinophaga sp.]|uniref:hypothetical protein n=1 Tax=Chitinophaga sp. TaxID=1869181 RepID=UPI002C40DB2A|nr:hypothetical protein [Chitinophaga sp.]HVI44393.1 hypothetical protein [Chitinophaga sp.]